MAELLSVAEFAAKTDMKHLEVTRRIRRGQVRAKKVGWVWIIDGREVKRVKEAPWYKAMRARQLQKTTNP